MADPISPLLNYLNNLMTAKASFRLLIVICFIFLCITNIHPYLLEMEIPSEISMTLSLLIGFASGSLVSSFLSQIYNFSMKCIKSSIKKRKKEKEEIELQQKQREIDNVKIATLTESLCFYSKDAKEILIKLLEKNMAFELENSSDLDNAISGLLKNEIILRINEIDQKRLFLRINPTYKECIKNHFDEEFKSDIETFFYESPKGSNLLIDLFSDKNEEDDHIFEIPSEYYDYRHDFYPLIKYETYTKHHTVRYANKKIFGCDIQFYINPFHYELLCEKLNVELREFILCKYEKKEC